MHALYKVIWRPNVHQEHAMNVYLYMFYVLVFWLKLIWNVLNSYMSVFNIENLGTTPQGSMKRPSRRTERPPRHCIGSVNVQA